MALNNVDNGNEQTTTGSDNAVFLDGRLVPSKVDFTIIVGGANEVQIRSDFRDGHGIALTANVVFNLWLSDNAAGRGLTGTTPSGALAAVSANTEIFADLGNSLLVADTKKALVVQTGADGGFILSITDTAKTGFFIAVQNPFSGLTSVSRQLVSGDYGA